MCNARTLAHNSEGYIIKCRECKRMQLAFGTAVLIINEAQLNHIKERLQYEIMYKDSRDIRPDIKQVSIEINEYAMLCLSLNEMISLQDLADQACAVSEAYQILDRPMEWEN